MCEDGQASIFSPGNEPGLVIHGVFFSDDISVNVENV